MSGCRPSSLAWALGALLEGLVGFGYPWAVVAPILVGLGVAEIDAIRVAAIGNNAPVSYGALGARSSRWPPSPGCRCSACPPRSAGSWRYSLCCRRGSSSTSSPGGAACAGVWPLPVVGSLAYIARPVPDVPVARALPARHHRRPGLVRRAAVAAEVLAASRNPRLRRGPDQLRKPCPWDRGQRGRRAAAAGDWRGAGEPVAATAAAGCGAATARAAVPAAAGTLGGARGGPGLGGVRHPDRRGRGGRDRAVVPPRRLHVHQAGGRRDQLALAPAGLGGVEVRARRQPAPGSWSPCWSSWPCSGWGGAVQGGGEAQLRADVGRPAGRADHLRARHRLQLLRDGAARWPTGSPGSAPGSSCWHRCWAGSGSRCRGATPPRTRCSAGSSTRSAACCACRCCCSRRSTPLAPRSASRSRRRPPAWACRPAATCAGRAR